MNLNEAYKTLELSSSATPDEAKKKYRELTKKYHPDINKDPNATDTFKKINEAYECVKSGKGSDQPQYQQQEWNQGFNFNISDLFNQQRKQQTPIRQEPDISVNASISFKESVLGHKHDITFKRKLKCEDCDGAGSKLVDNGCLDCGGKGVIISQQGNMISQRTCIKCNGKTKTEKCLKCNSKGFVDSVTALTVNIPAGILNGQTLRLQHMGHYAGSANSFMGMSDLYSNVNIKITVGDSKGMRIEGHDVVSDLNISLLEAIKGCSKQIMTINGNQDININPKSKHKDEVILPKLGLNKVGSHRVKINVDYPEDIDTLVQHLSE